MVRLEFEISVIVICLLFEICYLDFSVLKPDTSDLLEHVVRIKQIWT